MATINFTETVTMVCLHCADCNMLFAITADYKYRLTESHETFYCPKGHHNYFSGKNETQQLQEQLREKERQLIHAANNNLQKEQEIKKITRQLKRVKKGVCPCCNRTFGDLARHMKTKHPEKI